MKIFKPEGQLITTEENRRYLSSPFSLREAYYSEAFLEGRVTRCDSEHNLHIDLGCMKGIIPRNEGALGIEDGSVRDIALISRVNKPVVFVITGFVTEENGETVAMLSRRRVQQECTESYISALRAGDIIPATVSHIEGFGVFCDIGAGLSALMPIDSISISRIPHPSARFSAGQSIKAVVKSIDSAGRITLSHKELLGTWEQNAALFSVGETVPGIVRSVEKYGIFVELTPNLAGLAEFSEGIEPGCHAGVYIKSIIPSKMKIKLIIVDSFAADYPAEPPKYFLDEGRIDRWLYSPPESEKIIESVF
ncbi:MAG: S1 RNA-binding domain-containing protein [Oscillospiraceae bacterium]|nr:S1 RNA-binding domain-containing protein [Clostridiaceae bacterium]MDO4496181.1 S1 RNA-binding domain-containing protein [Clostridiaceae bacterium]MDY5948167.1 S1 RNA-binding domain-containing protein [Oscillospiraceae bacterium]